MSIAALAQDFDATSLLQIAKAAEHRAKLIRELEAKPWRRTTEQNDAIDTFDQLAWYCRKVVAMQEG